uniref:Putative hexosyltransferase n=1 Tax=uncultured Acidobacteriota bacterium TaxID=171953 RepID=Q7X2W2_9BACT|nr:putative hexosyltransferase [uncultured Acidobacteriota bacterium]
MVVQRYGLDINGGAELHARYIAELLRTHAEVRVLTTCARDYVTWRNELPAGEEVVNGIPVERFEVSRERSVEEFGRLSTHVFEQEHSLNDELEWLDSEGPVSPRLLERLTRSSAEFDFVLLFSARYHTAYHGARATAGRAVLVPTAEREASLGLQVFQPLFRGVRAIMYNSFEERRAITTLAGNQTVPGVVVGIGSRVPTTASAARARERWGLHDPFVLYVGRIDVNKGCGEMFEYFTSYLAGSERAVDLVLVGNAVMTVPDHPRIKRLGFVSDAEKFDLLAAAELLVMPSYFESLSMVALEAWALGRPVLANARCEVLVGQCLRSNAGLYYGDAEEFGAALDLLLDNRPLADSLGQNGRAFYARHYDWPVIESKYLTMLETLQRTSPTHTMEPLPGWLERRRRRLSPAARVLEAVPSGPVTDGAGIEVIAR